MSLLVCVFNVSAANSATASYSSLRSSLTLTQLKESIKMMKQLVDGGMVSPSELDQIKKEFRDNMGTDVEDLIKMAEEQKRNGELDKDGEELLDLFKQVLD